MKWTQCFYCGNEFTKLCDGVLCRNQHPEHKQYVDTDDPHTTCDRPICDECATVRGNMFFDGTDDNGEHIGEVDTIDYCPQCIKERRDKIPAYKLRILPKAEAEALQQERLKRPKKEGRIVEFNRQRRF